MKCFRPANLPRMVSSKIPYTLLKPENSSKAYTEPCTSHFTKRCAIYAIILCSLVVISTVYAVYNLEIEDILPLSESQRAPRFHRIPKLLHGKNKTTSIVTHLTTVVTSTSTKSSTSTRTSTSSSTTTTTTTTATATTTTTTTTATTTTLPTTTLVRRTAPLTTASVVNPIPKFVRRPEVEGIDCQRLFDNDKKYAKEVVKSRTVYEEKMPLPMSCESIIQRVAGDMPRPFVNYSIAIAREVYKDYAFLEYQLASTYSPENHYCYIPDLKSDVVFKNNVKRLSECLPNVHVPSALLALDSAGHNLNAAHFECMKLLIKQNDWKYVMLLQNHDVILHSHAELAKIFSILNGANDISVGHVPGGRINPKLNWTIQALGVFTNETPLSSEERKNAKLEFGKGYMQASLSREAVDWMVNKVNMTKMIQQMNSMPFGVDEQFLNTLHISDTLGMPGGIHHSCLGKINFMTRATVWGGSCAKIRHAICIFGAEDLPRIEQFRKTHLTFNKMLPDYDFAAISCVAEAIHNRTYSGRIQVDEDFVRKHSSVRYQAAKQRPGFSKQNYTCTDL